MLSVGTLQTSSLEAQLSRDRATLTLVVSGSLDMKTSGSLWREALHLIDQLKPIGQLADKCRLVPTCS